MLNTMQLPKPGPRLGRYPQRTSVQEPLSWYSAQLLRAKLEAPRTPTTAELTQFLQTVNEKRTVLEGCDIEFIAAGTRRLQQRLVVDGLRPPLIAELFALIAACFKLHFNLHLHNGQLTAARLMLDRRLVEIQTGEGKTLAVALAAATGALAGIPVHVITANDYLAERDTELLAPAFASLSLTTGLVTAEMDSERRREQYRSNITYCTAKELAFDHLRDQIAMGGRLEDRTSDSGTILRGLCMAIIDEADSILIDEARMPLILSGPSRNAEQAAFYRQALFLAAQLRWGEDFLLDVHRRSAVLTESGSVRAETLAKHLRGGWSGRRRREETLCLALAARHLFLKDRHYLVRDKQIVIIDDTTGRAANGRVWSRGLHQLIEVKESCPVTDPQNTVAQTTFQQFFSRYLRLSGVSGTLKEARIELLAIYGLPVATVGLQSPSRREMLPTKIFVNRDDQWHYVVQRVRELQAMGRPVLIGTDSVNDSEMLSAQLKEAAITHTVLNARHDAAEAEIVALAGQPGAVTVSTNMAGRGTDIRLGHGVSATGGLHVIACQVNDSGRVDRQLYGRCARQGEPGSVEQLYCLENGFQPLTALARFALRFGGEKEIGPIRSQWLGRMARLAQLLRARYRRREHWFFYLHERQVHKQLAFAGKTGRTTPK